MGKTERDGSCCCCAQPSRNTWSSHHQTVGWRADWHPARMKKVTESERALRPHRRFPSHSVIANITPIGMTEGGKNKQMG
jgi:hypothetical protein